jgi:hypothetical protein
MRTLLRKGLLSTAAHLDTPAVREETWRAVRPLLTAIIESLRGARLDAAQLALAAALVDVSKSLEGASLEQVQQLLAQLWGASKEET